MLSPILLKIRNSNLATSIYVKTHPKGYTIDHKPKLQIQIVSKGKDMKMVQAKYREIFSLLMGEIDKLNGRVIG
jgi:hypothetical protein